MFKVIAIFFLIVITLFATTNLIYWSYTKEEQEEHNKEIFPHLYKGDE